MFDPQRSWFHHRDGLFFQRQHDGAVTIAKFPSTTSVQGPEAPEFELTIPAAEWASIVASVCAVGENAGSYVVASRFHDRGPSGFTLDAGPSPALTPAGGDATGPEV